MKTLELNLDCPNTVESFIKRHFTIKGRRLANILGLKGKGSTKCADLISGYVWNKYTAMLMRKQGKISIALQYEAICDRIYSQMPDKIKW
jgi:hypothetical protein